MLKSTSLIRKLHRSLLTPLTFSLVIVNDYKFYVDFKGSLYFDQPGPLSPANIIKDKKFVKKLYQSLRRNEGGVNPEY